MCVITVTELENNLSFYLKKSKTEDIYITKNDEIISVLISPKKKAYLESIELIESLSIDKSIIMTDKEIIEDAIESKLKN